MLTRYSLSSISFLLLNLISKDIVVPHAINIKKYALILMILPIEIYIYPVLTINTLITIAENVYMYISHHPNLNIKEPESPYFFWSYSIISPTWYIR